MTSKAIVRSAEDVDEKALSYAEIKALSTGNPLILEKTELETQVSKLKLLKQSYLSQIYNLEDMITKYYPVQIIRTQNEIENIKNDMEIIKNNTEDKNEEQFSPMKLKEKVYYEKESAGSEIIELCKAKDSKDPEHIGEYRGLKMFLEIDTVSNTYEIKLKANGTYKVSLGTDKYGNITRIDNVMESLSKKLEDAERQANILQQQLETAKVDVKVPFEKEMELTEKQKRLNEVNKLLKVNEKDNEILDDEIDKEEINEELEEVNEKRNKEREISRDIR